MAEAEEYQLLLLIPSRTLRANGGDFLGYFAFDATDSARPLWARYCNLWCWRG